MRARERTRESERENARLHEKDSECERKTDRKRERQRGLGQRRRICARGKHERGKYERESTRATARVYVTIE